MRQTCCVKEGSPKSSLPMPCRREVEQHRQAAPVREEAEDEDTPAPHHLWNGACCYDISYDS